MTHVTMEIDVKRLLSVRDALIGMVAAHDNAQAAIDKACLEVRRFMTAELHAKYQAIFNLFYAPLAERTVFPPDHGTFHPYYTPAYMRLCGLIGSLVYALPIRVGIPWMHYRRGNPAIPPNVYDNDNGSSTFYSTEDRIHHQVTSPNVRWAVFPPGIGARYILAKCMFVTQTPARPFVVITNTSHQMEWVRILATVCGWTVENGSVFLFGLCTPGPVTFAGSELKVVVINCHDFHHVEPSICNSTLCVGLTIVDGSTIDDEPWFRPPMTRDLMGQIYPSPLLILSPPLRIPSMTILDCGPIARSIVTNRHSHVELPMIEFSHFVHCVDVFNGHACFTPLFEAEIRAWIQQRWWPPAPQTIITSEVGFRSTSKYMSPRYTDKVIHMASGWRSETQLSRTAKRIAQAMCFTPHGGFDDMFYDAVLIPTFHETCQPMCASREIERWECSVCYCSFADCAKPWDALVTQCCSTEVCARCYFQATRVHRKCIICGPAHHITMPFVPAICVYKTPEPPTTLVPPIPEIEFYPNEQLVRTIFDVDYPRVLLQALRKYVEAFPEVTILMTPTPFHLRVERSCLSPFMVEFKEKTFREFTNTARIIMWDPDLTPIQALPRLANITDIVIGDAAHASQHVDNLVRWCCGSREKLCVRYIHWATSWMKN